MDKIKEQSSKVSKLVFSGETGSTYRKTLILTWDILWETGILIWLTVCLLFVGAEWFWKTSIALGLKARGWYESTKESKAEEPKSASEVGQSVLTALNSGTETLVYQAKKQLGIDAEPPAPKPSPAPKAIAQPKPTATPPAPEPSKPTVAEKAQPAAEPSADPSSAKDDEE
ncbi:MAG: hypothetical protein F6K42_10765 [Leptolyngbya sp. SIO1D8]|nr:hypothetical protein [Leptolyngbya sp. SIO1D8]